MESKSATVKIVKLNTLTNSLKPFDTDSSSRPTKKLKKLGKDPSVDTSFLPDAEREAQEAEQRALLQKKWLEEQEKIKKESIHITYSFWDGSGHRKSVTCKKGDTIAQFLEKAKAPFSNLKGVHVDNLLYIKEDLIIPHVSTYHFLSIHLIMNLLTHNNLRTTAPYILRLPYQQNPW